MSINDELAGIFMDIGGGIIDLPNLEWFIKTTESYSDAGVTPAIDNDPIYQHNDASPNEIDLVQTISTNRPLYKANIVNGKPVTRFDGIDNIMTAGDNLDGVFAGADKKFTIICNISNFSDATRLIILAKYANLSGARQFFTDINSGLPRFFYYIPNASQIRGISADASIGTDSRVITFVYDGSLDTNDGLDRVVIRVDGSEISRSVILSPGGFPFDISDTNAPLTVGGWYQTAPASNPTYTAGYDFGSMVVLSDPAISDIETVENEMINDWGL